MKSCHLKNSLWGMGDHIWQLPIVRELTCLYDTVYLDTPWPEFYWPLNRVKTLHPSYSRSQHQSWDHYRESILAYPNESWARPEANDLASATEVFIDEIYYETKSRIRSMQPFPLPEVLNLSFPLKTEWLREASSILEDRVPGRPRALIHLPSTDGNKQPNPRFAPFSAFRNLYEARKDRVNFFDFARIIEGSCEPIGILGDMPVIRSMGGQAPLLWAVFSLCDMVICTDNHALPLSMAFRKPTVYLGGNVPLLHLFDDRVDASQVFTVTPQKNGSYDEGEILLAFDQARHVAGF